MKKTPTKIKKPNKRVRVNPPRISKTPNKNTRTDENPYDHQPNRHSGGYDRFGICE